MKNAVLLCLLFYTSLLSGQSADCPLPDDISCNDQINVTLGPIDGTYSLTPQMVIGYPDGLDPCVYGQLRVSPSFVSCANVGSTAFYELIHSPADGPETSLCWGYVVAEDKTAPTFTSCPASSLYISLETNTQLTLTPADLGVSATDNCSATLATNPAPFVITSADNGSTLAVDVIAADPSGNTSTCTVSVNVSVDNCSTGADAPENLAVALADPDVVFSWDAVPGAGNYAISLEYYEVRNGKKGKWKSVGALPPAAGGTNFSVPLAGLNGAALHRFSVAVSGGGNNCTAVIEFTPNILAGTSGRPLPPGTTPRQAAPGFQAFPNPVEDQLKVHFAEALPRARQLRLLDLQGCAVRELLAARYATTARIDVNGLSKGVYLLQVQDGTKLNAEKVLVK